MQDLEGVVVRRERERRGRGRGRNERILLGFLFPFTFVVSSFSISIDHCGLSRVVGVKREITHPRLRRKKKVVGSGVVFGERPVQ